MTNQSGLPSHDLEIVDVYLGNCTNKDLYKLRQNRILHIVIISRLRSNLAYYPILVRGVAA
jgi:hypothetical protein